MQENKNWAGLRFAERVQREFGGMKETGRKEKGLLISIFVGNIIGSMYCHFFVNGSNSFFKKLLCLQSYFSSSASCLKNLKKNEFHLN